MRRAARSPWEVFAVRCLMGSSGLFVAAWLRIVVVSEDIPWVHLDVLYDFYGFFICMHTHILINRFSGLERGMSPDLWQDVSDAFSKSCVEWNGWSWLVMIGHPSESETRSQGAELDLLAWLCQELSGSFSTGGDDPNWAKVRHYRETQEDEGLPGCTSAWFATATESTNGEERNIELYRCVHCRCLDTLDVQMYGMYVYIALSYNVFYTCTYIHCGMVWYATQCNALQWNVL